MTDERPSALVPRFLRTFVYIDSIRLQVAEDSPPQLGPGGGRGPALPKRKDRCAANGACFAPPAVGRLALSRSLRHRYFKASEGPTPHRRAGTQLSRRVNDLGTKSWFRRANAPGNVERSFIRTPG